MKLLIALVVVSSVMLKVQAGDVAYGGVCVAGDVCTAANSECKDDGTGTTTNKCLCKANYEAVSSVCKLVAGQACTDATKANCASGVCSFKKCGGTVADGTSCTSYLDCQSLICYDGDCWSGASAIVASLALMLTTLVTTRFL